MLLFCGLSAMGNAQLPSERPINTFFSKEVRAKLKNTATTSQGNRSATTASEQEMPIEAVAARKIFTTGNNAARRKATASSLASAQSAQTIQGMAQEKIRRRNALARP